MRDLSNMNFTKSFDRARNTVKGCLFSAMGLCILALLLNENYPTPAIYCTVAAVALIVIGVVLVALCLKCPYCGKQIISKCLTVTVCPHCKRNLTTGMKGKNKKKR